MGGWDRVRAAEGGGGEPGGDDIIMSYLLLECFWFFFFFQPAKLKFSANYFTLFSVWITQAALVLLERNQPLRGQGIGGGASLWIEGVRGYDTLDLDEAPSLRNNALYFKCSIIAVKCIKRSGVLLISLWLIKRPFVAVQVSFSPLSVVCFGLKGVKRPETSLRRSRLCGRG